MSMRWEDHDPGDEDPAEFTRESMTRWLEWSLAHRLRPYIGTTPIHPVRTFTAELVTFVAEVGW